MKYLPLLSLLLTTQADAQKSSNTAASTSKAPLQFTSPIQSFTIFDKSVSVTSPRGKFLPRLRAGLLGERRAREVLNNELRSPISDGNLSDGGWAEHSAKAEELRKKSMEGRIERGYDEATKLYDAKLAARDSGRSTSGAESSSAYQFVGVVNKDSSEGEVSWYARKKPQNSKWNMRLIHVNRNAVLRDLFVKGKIDLYGGYKNEGMGIIGGGSGEESGNEGNALKPNVLGEYSVRERSWRTLWNFSPIRFFTTPSGSYHRERRLTPGIYTDGTFVYESVYRYRDGKNGMKRIATLDKYVESLGAGNKDGIIDKLSGVPDVVVEK